MSATVPMTEPQHEPVQRPAAAASPNQASFVIAGGSAPSWLISLAGHVLILAALWPIHLATQMMREPVVSGSVDDEESLSTLPQDSLHFDTAVVDQIGNGGDTSAPGERVAPLGASVETPRAPVLNVVGAVSALGTAPLAIKRPMLEVGAATPDRELSDLVETTGSTEHAGGVRGAIDRLTIEIEASLRQENTLVIWLFDATPSMQERRNAIADRFENIYKQLGLLGVGGNGALKTVVGTFGRTTEYLTPKPIDDVSKIQKSIRKIHEDIDEKHGAVENVFGAALSAAERFRSFRTGAKDRRRVMIVLVTDERGSDDGRVEQAIVRLRKLGMRVYCVGDDAVFGRPEFLFPFVHPNGYHGQAFTFRGPETYKLESLQMTFWGGRGTLDQITSGFGPYALCRLCAETGGLYLISEELPGPKFDPAILRNYLPDYRPAREYEAECSRNSAKEGLVRAAEVSWREKISQIPRPQTQFRADNDNTLKQQLTNAQRPWAELDYRLNEMYVLLEAGERDRARLDTLRWRASYDLALGRVLAMRARAMGYNMMLAEMKTMPHPFQNPGSNTWQIIPAGEEHSPPRIQKFAKKARELLEGLVRDHRGTPWELVAREELRTPMAWDWRETHVDYPPPAPPQPARNAIQLEEDRQREMMRRQQQPEARPPLKL